MSQAIEIVPLTGAIGAEVRGLELADPLGDEDMNARESAAPFDCSLARCRQISSTCQVCGHPGTLTMWDNRCTRHQAIDDYAGHCREMNRVTAADEQPVIQS